MPGGGHSDSDSERAETQETEYKKHQDGETSSKSSNSDKSSKKDDKKSDKKSKSDDDEPQWHGGGEHGNFMSGNDPLIPESEQWTTALNVLMLVTLGLSWLLMIIITATRSWGVGKVLPQKVDCNGCGITAGLWDVCAQGGCEGWDSFCPDASGHLGASKATCIITILIITAMLVLQVMIKVKAGNCPSCIPKCQTVLSHLLWFFIMLSWVFWAALHNQTKCGEIFQTKWRSLLFYAWGWMFLVWMWLVHMFTAILVTLKVLGRTLPCGM